MADDTQVQDQAPPDVGAGAPPPDATGLTPAPGAPTPPPKESFLQGFGRGAAGESYVVDASGNMTNARTTAPSGKGLLGSILAGAVMGALHGASGLRKGLDNPDAGVGAGVRADLAARQQQDLLKRQQAQENFTRQQSVAKMTREQAESAAQVNHYNALTAQIVQQSKWAVDEHPLEMKLKEMSLETQANALNASRLAQSENNVKLLETLADMNLDPQVVLKEYQEAKPYISQLAQGQLLGVPNGTHGEGHGAALFDVDSLRQPLTKDVTFDVFTLDPKTGDLVRTPHTLKKGASTWDYVTAVMKGNADLNRIQSTQRVQGGLALQKAQADEARAKAGLDEAQVDMFKKNGVVIPENFAPDANAFKAAPQDLARNLSQKGVTVPANFATLYGIAHYKLNPSTLPARTTNRPGSVPQMDQQTGMNYIRTFINPNYDENNFKAVQELEKQFADTRPNTAGGNLLSMNAAIGHLGQLYDAMDALKKDGQTQLQTFNRISQALSTEFGRPVAPNFNAIKGVLVGELGKTFAGKAPDIPEVATLNQQLNAAQSPDIIKGVITQFSHAMLTKGDANIQRYYDYTGELPPSALSQQSLQTLGRLGIQPGDVLPAGASVPTGAVGNLNAGVSNPPAGGAKAPEVPPPVAKALASQAVGWHKLSDGSFWYKAGDGKITPGSESDFNANKPR